MTKARRKSNIPTTAVATVPGSLCGNLAASAKQITIAVSNIVLEMLTRKSFRCLRVCTPVVYAAEQVRPTRWPMAQMLALERLRSREVGSANRRICGLRVFC